MPEKISDDDFKEQMLDFKTEMMRFVEVANQKFDGLTSDVRSVGFRVDKVEAKIDNFESRMNRVEGKLDNFEKGTEARFNRIDEKLDVMSKQFRAVTEKVFENEDILKDVHARVVVLEGETH